MAASIYRRKVVGEQLLNVNRFRCYFVSYFRRTYLFHSTISRHFVANELGTKCPDPRNKYKTEFVYIDRNFPFGSVYKNTFHNVNTDLIIIQDSYPTLFSDKNGMNLSNSFSNPMYQNRQYSNEEKPPRKYFPRLMDFPEIVWPNVIKTMRNWILARLIIRPYFDQEFSLHHFVQGSAQALEVVSGHISNGDFDGLEGLVIREALSEIKSNISNFSMQQRQELSICKDDIYFSFPYQIGVMFNDDDVNQQRFVEITMCYHALRGLKEMREEGHTPPINMGLMPQYRDKIHICNYRFIREFTKGVEDQWCVNVVNHFKPSDIES